MTKKKQDTENRIKQKADDQKQKKSKTTKK